MPLHLYPAVPDDAGRISEIHMEAFASNAMLLAQFPTPGVRDGLRESIRLKALADIDDPKISVLVVRDIPRVTDAPNMTADENCSGRHSGVNEILKVDGSQDARTGKVVAFAKWSHPVGRDEEYEETAWKWPPGTDVQILESWGRATEEAQKRAVGDQSCYRLTFMGTDPAHERRGAASMMVRWGLAQCKKYNIPGYLESTLHAAPFYEKMGFARAGNISLRYPIRVDGHDRDEVYNEIAFVYHPTAT
ncbi:putative GNAT family acetyltransferase [Xylaria palmicola]|nr:putative GNAT family acetyltransferase [Xylaria palmicola]